jgi:radical SAM superfamily enzyme YgiQ (UPF0313 family)
MFTNFINNKKKYTLYLINPKFKYQHYGTQKELGALMGKKNFIFSLALSIIAAFTPDHYKIKIINDEIEKIPFNKKPDLVGITTPFTTLNRSIEIADKFQEKGIPVIMGGYYATFVTDEILKHADSVVIGEVEGIWETVLKDFEQGKLKKIYKTDKVYDFKKIPIPRWDLVDTKNLNFIGIQASRGCPFACEFCIVSKLFGRKQRYRDIDNVIEEIKSISTKRIFFVDDNFTFNKEYARKLMKEMKGLGLSWVCQSSIEIVDDDELLDEMYEAGCISVLIGFESLNPESLKETKKFQNDVAYYEKAIQKIHSKGLQLIASFVVGFDSDTDTVFDDIYKFSKRNNILFTMISTLTVAPGTKLYEKYKKENRLLNIEPELFNGSFPCAKYKNISTIDMYDNYYKTLRKLFSIESRGNKVINLIEAGSFKSDKKFDDIGFFEKFFSSFKVLNKYYFTKNKSKKDLFRKLVTYGVNKTISWDYIGYLLFAIGGFDDYIESIDTFYDEIREKMIKIQNEDK